MYCPQCGQQQVSDITRFCARCGFLLDGVMAVLASGGEVPTRYVQPGNQKPSPRSKGVRQGAMLMLSTILVVPIVAILSVNLLYGVSHILTPLAALFCFVGGLLRILYALLMEDAVAPMDEQMGAYAPPAMPQFNRPIHNAALPPAAVNQPPVWKPRPSTAEIYQPPPSVTENTTRLLDKDDPKKR
jgi:hypothetical protein